MIKIKDILKIDDPTQYKLHLACRNEDWVSPRASLTAIPLRPRRAWTCSAAAGDYGPIENDNDEMI